eukprot:GHRR01001403.1.p1 GENE.GHRR01001403.1~~GHRR01001403.1.p1  ORF type:complete len:453 (+),score=134.03 GHRR01001403.1:286-1644(+)
MNLVKDILYEIKNWYVAATWTEKDIPNLEGKTIMVTGATDGVGLEAARAFAEHGARVIIHGRNEDKARHAVEYIRRTASPKAQLEVMLCDLTDFQDIKSFADDFKAKGWPLHVLLNNAGIQAPYGHRGQKTPGGFEVTMSSNHFGPLYLTFQLLDVLKASAPSRLVFVNSVGSQLVNPPYLGGNSWFPGIDWFIWPGMNWDDLKGEHYPDSDWWQYSRTKLMNLMTGKEMARRLQGTGVEVFIAHPGLTRTDHFGKADTDANWSSQGVEAFANSFWGTDKKMGAIPLMFACTDLSLKGRNGSYVGSPELGPVNYFQAGTIRKPNAPLARDPWACRRLVDASILILKEIDPDMPAEISPDGQVLVDRGYHSKVQPSTPDGTSGLAGLAGPRTEDRSLIDDPRKLNGPGGIIIGKTGVPDAQRKTGRSAYSIGRRPAPLLATFRNLFMAVPHDI